MLLYIMGKSLCRTQVCLFETRGSVWLYWGGGLRWVDRDGSGRVGTGQDGIGEMWRVSRG